MANITVTFHVEYGVDTHLYPPTKMTLTIPEGCTVFNLVQIAEENDSERHSFKYRTLPDFGTEITTIDGVEEDPANDIYWFFYSPWNKLIPNGVSSHKLRHRHTTVFARYERWSRSDHGKQKAPRGKFMNFKKTPIKSNKIKKQEKDKNNNMIKNNENRRKF